MGSAMTESATRDLLIQQMVSTITELDGQAAIENALEWLRRECNSERAMFFQFKGPLLLTFITSNVDDAWGRCLPPARFDHARPGDPLLSQSNGLPELAGCVQAIPGISLL